MTVNWTVEQVISLAPDTASAKAGKSLAVARKWPVLGCDDQSAWGECQGSGKQPYQTQIDLSGPAFNCSCPSHKFPCKHGLGLFLLLVNQPEAFTQHTPPAWVSDWLKKRTQRAAQRQTRQKRPKSETTADSKAQLRSAAEREARVTAGLQTMELWLHDLVRQGLASVQDKPASFWEAQAARMEDAQSPGLARLVRNMAGLPVSGEGWQARLLEHLGRLYMLIEGFKRLESLPPTTQADVRASIGWVQNQDELLAEVGVRDQWLVLAQYGVEEKKLYAQYTWLWGKTGRRPALVLEYAYGQPRFETGLLPGVGLEADLVFYPSAYPLRALVKARHMPPQALDSVPGYANVTAASQAYAAGLALNPWLEAVLLVLENVIPMRYDDQVWIVRDVDGRFLPLPPRFQSIWALLALSGGWPVTVCGEWDGASFMPLSVWADGRLVELS